ncbi:hypothetical protein D9758_000769 [Tetrapyrgos nigripes]|uniref:Aldehyde dehydrogenase domain-containing protein n=1 Tax=Tetrapyrgos nigripes TaxID=182062 RepID=A0A8H5GZI5_9AGAR|nr:hypothetical protein D9758_000769 [Tetrapyrgos nigripes]
MTARRILWGKAANAGQTCVAPDYIIVPKEFQDTFVKALKEVYDEFYPDGPGAPGAMSRLVTPQAFNRVNTLLKNTNGTVVIGGETDEASKFIAPTVVKDVKPDDSLMSEEIFGPVLPIMPVNNFDEGIAYVNAHDHPLSLYVFTQDDKLKTKVFESTQSGSAHVNETIIHPGAEGLPFGGIGPSGSGYHTGKYGFDMFTHLRSSISPPGWIDMIMSFRFPPYTTLFHSFGGEHSQNVRPETVQNLTEKLSELLGEDVVRDAFANGGMGAERFNEEGLPVVEITEPAPTSAPTTTNTSLLNEPELVLLDSLSPAERERRRQERDRILDLLEEEETLEQRREEERERLEQIEAAQKRKEAAKLEMERLKMARETQKKMGKALLRSVSGNKEETSDGTKEKEKEDGKSTKKSVSFAAESQQQESAEKIDWGDIAFGKLRATKQLPTLLSQNFQDGKLMKSTVVERIPGVGRVNAAPTKSESADSDDESDIDDGEDSGGDELEEEEFDAYFAQQQREIALEYHRKRRKFDEAAAAALTSHSHSPEEDVLVGDSSSKSKPAQLSSSYATSQSLDASVLPASAAQTLQRSIRMGKLDSDNNLVGRDAGESDSEPENENVREVMELLRKGEVYNVGPNSDIHSVPRSTTSELSATKPSLQAPPFTAPTPLPSKPKNSQFKLSRPQNKTSSMEAGSEPATPISVVGRSSPKLPTVGSLVEASGSKNPLPPGPVPSPPSMVSQSPLQIPDFSRPMIIESPSFPQDSRSSRRPERPPEIMSASVRESAPRNREVAEVESVDGDDEANRPPKKVSRFKAERM